MSEHFDRETVLHLHGELDQREKLRRLFGSCSHQYKLDPPQSVAVVETFEARHDVSLPGDYRSFLTENGHGGAGPYHGVLPFGKDDDARDWEGGELVDHLSKPFPHMNAWNLPDSRLSSG